MERVSDWLNRTEFERFFKAKFYRIVDSNGSELYDQLEARKYPQCWNVAPILGMVVTNVEETEWEFIVTARRSEDV
ncbi:MAG: hypothetical protein II453_17600 [Alphaproteobacteria bacterium]|nr:hypothetical protein [Alphaproteobacteria bacterium]